MNPAFVAVRWPLHLTLHRVHCHNNSLSIVLSTAPLNSPLNPAPFFNSPYCPRFCGTLVSSSLAQPSSANSAVNLQTWLCRSQTKQTDKLTSSANVATCPHLGKVEVLRVRNLGNFCRKGRREHNSFNTPKEREFGGRKWPTSHPSKSRLIRVQSD